MAKKKRFIMKLRSLAVKKAKAGRASFLHETQRKAGKKHKEIVKNLRDGEVRP